MRTDFKSFYVHIMVDCNEVSQRVAEMWLTCPNAAVSPVNVCHLWMHCPRLKALAQIRVASGTNHIEPWPAALNLHPVRFARAVCSQFQKPNKSSALFFLFQLRKVYLLKNPSADLKQISGLIMERRPKCMFMQIML